MNSGYGSFWFFSGFYLQAQGCLAGQEVILLWQLPSLQRKGASAGQGQEAESLWQEPSLQSTGLVTGQAGGAVAEDEAEDVGEDGEVWGDGDSDGEASGEATGDSEGESWVDGWGDDWGDDWDDSGTEDPHLSVLAWQLMRSGQRVCPAGQLSGPVSAGCWPA
ncbi:MAG: hypothetical protein ACAI44_20015 [Candidatus Sericytochromatia bacterium]